MRFSPFVTSLINNLECQLDAMRSGKIADMEPITNLQHIAELLYNHDQAAGVTQTLHVIGEHMTCVIEVNQTNDGSAKAVYRVPVDDTRVRSLRADGWLEVVRSGPLIYQLSPVGRREMANQFSAAA